MADREAALNQWISHRACSQGHTRLLWTPKQELTYAQADVRTDRYAATLQGLGVGISDRVLLLMGNSAEQVLLWMALERVGAVNVPLNTGLSTEFLARAIRTIRPRLIVADASHVEDLSSALGQPGVPQAPWIINEGGGSPSTASHAPTLQHLASASSGKPAAVTVDPLHPSIMLFTSGSTGVPKACVLSRRYVVRAGQIHTKYLRLRADDVLFTPFPLFHIDAATLTLSAAVAAGGAAAIAERFSASRFWSQVRASSATVFNFMGATANILWKQAPSEEDKQHQVRLAWGVPMPACEPGWEARFGFPLIEVYGLTDAGVPVYQPLDRPRVPGSCGRVIAEYSLRIGDTNGQAVAPGTVGEIMIRGNEPGLLLNEYFDMPEATAMALRGGWFHTGDFASCDRSGNVYFASRAKEVIRRRGENIAAVDIEGVIDAHECVLESAAVGVPSELSEDDIKVFVTPKPDAALDLMDLVDHCTQHLPRHMWPRYIELTSELPKTPTHKLERVKLGARSLNGATWDVESSDYVQPTTERTP